MLLAIILITIILAAIIVYCCQRNPVSTKNCKNRRLRTQKNNKKSKSNGGLDTLASDVTLQNPLVPRPTTAPGQGTADRPPPPLPPKFSRNAQLYQNLGSGIGHTQTVASYAISVTSGLPTVEVKFFL